MTLVDAHLEQEHRIAAEASAPTRSVIDVVGFPAEAPEWQIAWDDVSWSKYLVPVFSYGSIVTVAFDAIESLLTELVEIEEEASGSLLSDFAGGKSAPRIERLRLFLEREVGWALSWADGELGRRRAPIVRTAADSTQQMGHALGTGLSSESLRELTHVMEWSDSDLKWDANLAEVALYSVGKLAAVVEAGSASGPSEV